MASNSALLPVGLADLLEAKVARTVFAAGVTQVFDDSKSVWLLVEGRADLFAVQRRGGYQTGPREHLAPLTAGTLIWGIDQSSQDDGIHLLVQPDVDIHLYQLDIATIQELARTPEAQPFLIAALERWILALSTGVAKYLAPRRIPELSIGPGDELGAEESTRVASRSGMVWLELLSGGARYADVTELRADQEDVVVPIIAPAWIEAREGCRLRGHDTLSVVKSGDLIRRMDLFHGWVFFTLAYDLRNAITMEIGRLQRCESHVTDSTERTFSSLASLLDGGAHRVSAKAGEDQLFECCAEVGRAIGVEMVMPAWAKRRRASERPMSIDDVAIASMVRVRQVALRGQWWTEDNGPLVGQTEDGKLPVALLPGKNDTYVLVDPRTGQRTVVTEDVADTLSPIACYFYNTLPARPLRAADLLRFGMRSCRQDVINLLFAGALGGLVVTAIPIATGYVVDSVIPGHQTTQMVQVAFAMLAAAFGAAAFHFTTDVALLRIEGKVAGSVQAALMDRLLRLPSSFFADYSAGDLTLRSMVIETIRNQLTGVVLGSVVSGIFSVFNLIVLLIYSPPAALTALGLLALLGMVIAVIGVRLMRAVAEAEHRSGQVSSLVLELIMGVTKLRMAGAEERAFNLWGGKFREMRGSQYKARSLVGTYQTFWAGFEYLSLAVMFGVIAKLAGADMTTGVFLALIAAFTGLLTSAGALAQSAMVVFTVIPLYRRAQPILRALPETNLSKADPGTLTGEFEVNNVKFRYSHDQPLILKGVSLRARAGEFIAVVGPSGSGKSTLMRLLLCFERPEAGGVFFDGRDLRGLDLQRVRSQIGVVLQNGRLMPGSISENIKGATAATLEDCWEAARQVGMLEDIQAMPMGMHTVLTEGTTALSGGQVQRLLIARAIVGKPRILLLDEATSALDNRVQAVVTESLGRLRVTRVVIAHRLSTIIRADRIFVMQGGQLVESGTYQELVEMGGIFTELVRRQQL